jgi:hypothetical protein
LQEAADAVGLVARRRAAFASDEGGSSCVASEQFRRFAAFDQGITCAEDVLVRLLVRGNGTAFAVKVGARDAEPVLVQAATEYVWSCRVERIQEAKMPYTDIVTGRAPLELAFG